jgi:polyisoprenoid-binding protein YceI
MKNRIVITILTLGLFGAGMAQDSGKYITRTGHIRFFSETVAENIEANNYKVTSSLDPSTGLLVFSLPVQSFEFEKALMQKHFNQENFMHSSEYPSIKFKGEIKNLDEIDFSKNGEYKAIIAGELTIRGVTKGIEEVGKFSVSNGMIQGKSEFVVKNITGYGVGKPKSKAKANNVADDIQIFVDLSFEK